MQHQPDLKSLGMARLVLFRTFCLPSIVGQTSQAFLWIIRTDPDLDPELLEELTKILSPHPNFYLVKENDNSHRLPRDDEVIVTGDLKLLERQRWRRKQQSDLIFVETRLDADDGLRLNFVHHIQRILQTSTITEWMVFCIDAHLEWHSLSNSLVATKKDICVTPGLTQAVVGGHTPFPKLGSHHLMPLRVAPCGGLNSTSGTSNCLHRLVELPRAAAIRSRTPTSAGMAGVNSKPRKSNLPEGFFVKFLGPDFGIDENEVKLSQAFLLDHLQEIARDNLRGQCTKGHSCKEDSQAQLKELMNKENSRG